nr:T-complex protein gamma SU [Cryptomonas sp.]
MDYSPNLVHFHNITGAKAVADIIRTTLGPRAMLKMIIDNQGGIIVTNDGYCVLREIETFHPAARSLIELSRMQDNEIGDGTTTVVLLSAELLKTAEILLKKNFHPNQIIGGYYQALNDSIFFLEKILSVDLKKDNFEDMLKIILTSICTKFVGHYSKLICEIAFKAICKINLKFETLQTKDFIKVEKITGGLIEDSKILSGILIAKDVSHPKMRRFILNPKILLLDCTIDFKKGESKTSFEITDEYKWQNTLKVEENYTIYLCNIIKKFCPDVVVTEKNLSDLALHYLFKSNITVIRRVRKSDNNRLAKATGSVIVSNIEDLEASDIGIAGCFAVKKIGEEYYTFITGCKNTSCTIVLFGSSKDILDEIERNLYDAIGIAKSIIYKPRISPGGGATEFAISNYLREKSELIRNDSYFIYNSIAAALEIIPKILIENCGVSILNKISKLKDIHSKNGKFYGIEGKYGKICDMRKIGILEPTFMKSQIIKTAIENATMILRVDKVIYGLAQKNKNEIQKIKDENTSKFSTLKN